MNKLKFILLLLPLISFSQNCYDLFDDALYLSKYDEYKNLADSILDIEILNKSKNFNAYLLKSKFQYERGNTEKGFDFLTKAVIYGCHLKHHIFTNSFFKKHLTKSDSIKIMKLAENEVELPFKESNKLSLEQLYELVHWDQALNNFTIRYHDSMCITSSQSRFFELNVTRKMLRKYLEKNGYPDEKEFGYRLVDRFDLVVVHHFQNVDSCEWLKPFYDEAYKLNKISPERYYNYFDKLLVYKNLPQKYGTFSAGKNINGRYEIYPIEDIENIDELRNNLCLSPLHVFLKNNSFSIPESYRYDFSQYINSIRNKLKKN